MVGFDCGDAVALCWWLLGLRCSGVVVAVVLVARADAATSPTLPV